MNRVRLPPPPRQRPKAVDGSGGREVPNIAQGGRGVGVGFPVPAYLASIARRTSRSEVPAARIVITSRVTSRQCVQVAA
jgi:hypothetical protein